MKRKTIVAALAALTVLGSTAVYAQQRFHHHPRLSAEDRTAFAEARIAALKAGLQLTPDQEKNWPPVEAAIRDFAKQRIALADARRAARERGESLLPSDPVERIRHRADMMAQTAAGLKRIADAADPLYKSLDDGQKRRLAWLMHRGHHHFGWQGHGQDFRGFGPHRGPGFGGPDHDDGGDDQGPARL